MLKYWPIIRSSTCFKLGVAAAVSYVLYLLAGFLLPLLLAIGLAFALYPLVGCTATIPLLWAYNGGRGRPMKWFFYAYYPAHIAVLGLAKGLLLGDWNIAVTG